MFLTNTKQKTDPKSYKKNVTAEVIYISANKKTGFPRGKNICNELLLKIFYVCLL